MYTAIALTLSELPVELVEAHSLSAWVHDRGGDEKESRFDWRANPNVPPVWRGGQSRVLRWGNKGRAERKLPPTGWTWRETVEAGLWSALGPEPVEVPATYALANGVWLRVRRGVQGLAVRTRTGEPVVFLTCEPAARYYHVMTRCERMPALIGEVI